MKNVYFRYPGTCMFQEPIGRVIGKKGAYMDMYEYEIKDGQVYDYAGGKKWYPVKEIFPLKKCKFMGLTAMCPKNPLVILNRLYGKMKDLQPSWVCKKNKWLKIKG